MTAHHIHCCHIAENDQVQHLTYEGLLAFHQGEAIWGASVGFRAMQTAGLALSTNRLRDRKDLSVVSAHPGPGVRDAIEYVTRCVSRDRFRLFGSNQSSGCQAKMEFRWWVSDSSKTVEIGLCPGLVPSNFFDLLERVGSPQELSNDETLLETSQSRIHGATLAGNP